MNRLKYKIIDIGTAGTILSPYVIHIIFRRVHHKFIKNEQESVFRYTYFTSLNREFMVGGD